MVDSDASSAYEGAIPLEIYPTSSRNGTSYHSDVISNRPQSFFDLSLKLMRLSEKLR